MYYYIFNKDTKAFLGERNESIESDLAEKIGIIIIGSEKHLDDPALSPEGELIDQSVVNLSKLSVANTGYTIRHPNLISESDIVDTTFRVSIFRDLRKLICNDRLLDKSLQALYNKIDRALKFISPYLVPIGSILIWSGSTDDIPYSYHLCDGTNGTPDLRGKFIVHPDSINFHLKQTGGTLNHNHVLSGTTDGHVLTEAEMPSHNHSLRDSATVFTTYRGAGPGHEGEPYGIAYRDTGYAGGNQPHSHTIDSLNAAASSNIPPYYSLCYIMKLRV